MGADIGPGGDAGAFAQILGKTLGPFELSGGPGRPESGNICGAQTVGEAIDQRSLWPDHNQANILRFAPLHHVCVSAHIKRHAFRFFRNAGISGGGVELRERRGLRQLPR